MENLYTARNSRAFTLIEVLMASLILSLVFFAILSLISNNTRQTVTLTHSRTMDELFPSAKACISSFGYNYLSGITSYQSLHFGADHLTCATGSYDSSLSFSGIELRYTNDGWTGTNTYWNYFSVTDQTGSLKITTVFTDGMESKEYDFIMVP